MKFVLTHALDDAAMRYLDDNGVSVFVADSADIPSYIGELADADALIIRSGEFRKDVIDRCPKLKICGYVGIGFDCMDVSYATKQGIACGIAKGSNAQSVAEHTLAQILAFARDLIPANEEFHKGNWAARERGKSFELGGKKIGIIGVGGIGSRTAKLCQAFGMVTLGFQTGTYPEEQKRKEVEQAGCIYCDDLGKMLSESDFVTIHIPLNPSTENLIGEKELRQMKKTAFLINNSRGGIVNEEALADALNGGVIAGAACDVFSVEPLEKDNPLLTAKNFIGTPHAAALAKEAKARMMMMTAETCLAVCRGEISPNVVDLSVYSHRR